MKRFRAEEWLEQPADRGYPADYLIARVKGRRARLMPEWGPLLAAAAGGATPGGQHGGGSSPITAADPERSLSIEYRWLYGQMDRGLRNSISPFFLYRELRTIVVSLRYLREEKRGEMREVLSSSLLAPSLREMLNSAADAGEALQRLEARLLSLSAAFSGLSDVAAREGFRSFEKELAERFLAIAVSADLHPDMKLFFRNLIDARNLLGIDKWFRLRPAAAFVPLPGGRIPEERLHRILETGDREGVHELAREFLHAAGSGRAIEPALYRGISASLRKKGRESSGPGPLLDYLWRCSVEAMNLNLIAFGRDLERERLVAELV